METIFLLLGSMTFFTFMLVILLFFAMSQKPRARKKGSTSKEILKIKEQIEDKA